MHARVGGTVVNVCLAAEPRVAVDTDTAVALSCHLLTSPAILTRIGTAIIPLQAARVARKY